MPKSPERVSFHRRPDSNSRENDSDAARSLSVAAKKSVPTAQSGPQRASGNILSSNVGDPETPRLPLDPPGERR